MKVCNGEYIPVLDLQVPNLAKLFIFDWYSTLRALSMDKAEMKHTLRTPTKLERFVKSISNRHGSGTR